MRSPTFQKRIAHLRLELAPLASLSHGAVHPLFPRTILQFHLLTEEQLDELAHFYDQSTPTELTTMYPANMNWDRDFLATIDDFSIDNSAFSSITSDIDTEPERDLLMSPTSVSPKATSPWSSTATASAVAAAPPSVANWDGPSWTITLPYNIPAADIDGNARREESARSRQGKGSDDDDEDNRETLKRLARETRIAMKRRMFGKFIGLRGMETPTREVSMKLKFLEAKFWRLVEADRVASSRPKVV